MYVRSHPHAHPQMAEGEYMKGTIHTSIMVSGLVEVEILDPQNIRVKVVAFNLGEPSMFGFSQTLDMPTVVEAVQDQVVMSLMNQAAKEATAISNQEAEITHVEGVKTEDDDDGEPSLN